MKHFKYIRIILIILETIITTAIMGILCMTNIRTDIKCMLLVAVVLSFVLFLVLDYLQNRYVDDLLEQLTVLIEELVGNQEVRIFSELEDTLLSRLQHQFLKLRSILLKQNDLLFREKKQIQTLISDISHQIKTPVASANTFVQLLNDDSLSQEERKEYVAILQASLEKLTFLVNSFAKMSRLESGMIVLKPERNRLNDMILQAVKSVYSKAKKKNITMEFDCEREYQLYLDYNWTVEAITNVMDNAVKYTQNGGKVWLKLTEYASYIRLDITDNGIGIPEDEQAQIFNRFYRGKYSSGVDGVGIGLYLTRDIMNRQKGYIKVSSGETGTTFSLFFRIYASDEENIKKA